mmetsp:Transcript_48609/g.152548  ORF Transcript_48609/g.152548 Transcript_48609/m.152548 type:complete len:161 (-) Transcript_48609:193-675(-)
MGAFALNLDVYFVNLTSMYCLLSSPPDPLDRGFLHGATESSLDDLLCLLCRVLDMRSSDNVYSHPRGRVTALLPHEARGIYRGWQSRADDTSSPESHRDDGEVELKALGLMIPGIRYSCAKVSGFRYAALKSRAAASNELQNLHRPDAFGMFSEGAELEA